MSELRKTYAALVLESGGIWYGESPLHVTLGQPTSMTAEMLVEFIALLKVDLHEFGPVNVTGTEEAWYGPMNDLKVRRVARTAELLCLHELVLGTQIELNPELIIRYPDFNPHTTQKEHLQFNQYQRVMCDEVSVLQKPNKNRWRKVASIPLSQE